MFLEIFILALAGFFVFGNLETQARLRRINKALEEGRPQEFLRDIEIELSRLQTGPLRELLKLNRSAGLVYIGEFEQALHSLASVDREILSKGWLGQQRRFTEALYYNNYLYTLLCARRFDQAIEVWSSAAEKITPRTGHFLLDNCLKGTAATYHYHCGDASAARETLERLLTEPRIPKLYRAHRLYYLGRIDLHEGRFEQGLARLEEAARLAPNGFLAEEPKRLAVGEERIPPPGSGQSRHSVILKESS